MPERLLLPAEPTKMSPPYLVVSHGSCLPPLIPPTISFSIDAIGKGKLKLILTAAASNPTAIWVAKTTSAGFGVSWMRSGITLPPNVVANGQVYA